MTGITMSSFSSGFLSSISPPVCQVAREDSRPRAPPRRLPPARDLFPAVTYRALHALPCAARVAPLVVGSQIALCFRPIPAAPSGITCASVAIVVGRLIDLVGLAKRRILVLPVPPEV